MVTSTEPQENDDNVEIIEEVVEETEEVESQDEELVTSEDVPSGDAPSGSDGLVDTPVETVQQEPPPEATPRVDQQAIDELQQRRAADVQREWREKVGRTARAYEQQLQDQGYMPEQARDQARRYVQQEQRFQKQEKESSDMVQYVQGKQQAAVHFLKKHGLASKQMLDDFAALQQANTPAEMEREAQRMKRERSLIAENARLKQGRVAPQTFDNSQGSAEVTSNQDRLLEAYINGDRSEAAVRAAQRLAMGN